MTLESWSASMARLRRRPGARMCVCPQNSSSVLGLMRAARGSLAVCSKLDLAGLSNRDMMFS